MNESEAEKRLYQAMASIQTYKNKVLTGQVQNPKSCEIPREFTDEILRLVNSKEDSGPLLQKIETSLGKEGPSFKQLTKAFKEQVPKNEDNSKRKKL